MIYATAVLVGGAGALAFANSGTVVDAFVVAMLLMLWGRGLLVPAAQGALSSIHVWMSMRTLLTLDAMGGPAFRTAEDREDVRRQDAALESKGTGSTARAVTIFSASRGRSRRRVPVDCSAVTTRRAG